MKTHCQRLLGCFVTLAVFLVATVCVAGDPYRPPPTWAFARKGLALRGPEAAIAAERSAPETTAVVHPGLKVERAGPRLTKRADIVAAIQRPLPADDMRVVVDTRQPSPGVWIRFGATESSLAIEDARQVTKGHALDPGPVAKLAYSTAADAWMNPQGIVVSDTGLALRLKDSTLVPVGGDHTGRLEGPSGPARVEVAVFE
jgi:hypothetical protein